VQTRVASKLSISIPPQLERRLRKRAGRRGVSAFAARAIERELDRKALGDYLSELEERLGEVPQPLLEEARAAWRPKTP
jgi:hypothetical protein